MNINYRKLFLFLCLSVLFVHSTLSGQTSLFPELQQKAKEEIAKRGLDENVARARLRDKGIDIDNITPEQLPSLQGQIEAVIKELEAEKKQEKQQDKLEVLEEVKDKIEETANEVAKDKVQEGTKTVAKQKSAQVQEKVKKGATVEEAISEELDDAVKEDLPPAQIYGQSLFREKSMAIFRATNEVKPPDSYVLGVGDEITISVFGTSQFDSKFIINKEGFIQPTQMPKIFLRGVRLGQAKELLRSRFNSFYRFSPEQFAVSLTTARTITVNLFGELNTYGSFTISAINTAFNALVAAGGPTDIGSLRNISVVRNGKTTRMDVYTFMSNPTVQYDYFLEDNDIVHVPVAERIVSITGGVRRAFRYELYGNENLIKLVDYAGGFTANAYKEVVQIKRFSGDKQEQIDVSLAELIAQKKDFPLQDGDEVVVRIVESNIKNIATVGGEVAFPGSYALTETPRLSDLLKKSTLKREARTDMAFLLRKNTDQTTKLVQIDIGKILAAPGSADDLALNPGDNLTIYAQSRFITPATINVAGSVRNPVNAYPYDPDAGITLQRALLLAGGLTADANGLGYLIRTNPATGKNKEYVRVNLRAALDDPGSAENIPLRPFDSLFVFSAKTFTDASTVRIFGAVRTPGILPYSSSLTLKDVLSLSGGLKMEAATNRVEIFRVIMLENQPIRTTLATLEVDRELNIVGGGNADFRLLPYDEIVVRTTPGFELQQLVEVQGEVMYPGAYALLDDNETLSSVIKRAGGLTPEAFAAAASIYRAEGFKGLIVTRLDRALLHPGDLEDHILKNRDVITIPKNENLVTIRTANTNAGEVYDTKFLLTGQINVAYAGQKRARWYIQKYAAGFSPTADSSRVTVQELGGRIRGTKDFGLFRISPKVKKGAVITIKAKPPRQEKEKRERKEFDWDKAFSKILAVATTAATMIIAVTALNK